MNTNGLARHYDKLTARERLSLVLAAMDRGDDAEADRLASTAPRRTAGVSHYYGLWEGLAIMAVTYQMQQLDWAAGILAAGFLLKAGRPAGKEPPRKKSPLKSPFGICARGLSQGQAGA